MLLLMGCAQGCDHTALETHVGGSVGQEDGQEFEPLVVFEVGNGPSFSLHLTPSHVPFSDGQPVGRHLHCPVCRLGVKGFLRRGSRSLHCLPFSGSQAVSLGRRPPVFAP